MLDWQTPKNYPKKKREYLFEIIQERALAFSIARASVQEIDELNIFHASLLAMKRAVEQLSVKPDKVLVDGTHCPQVNYPVEAIIKGDQKIAAISAASIIAKVVRDRELCELDRQFPGYGFAQHKGYPTKAHIAALHKLGPIPQHRRSFAPVKKVLDKSDRGFLTTKWQIKQS